MNFQQRLWLATIFLLDYPFTLVGWIVWVIYPIDIVSDFKEYKYKLINSFEDDKIKRTKK